MPPFINCIFLLSLFILFCIFLLQLSSLKCGRVPYLGGLRNLKYVSYSRQICIESFCKATTPFTESCSIFEVFEIFEFEILKNLKYFTNLNVWTSYLHYVCESGLNLTMWRCRCMCAQPCLTLCDPMDCSPPGSSVRGIFQARILEWVATSFSRGSSQPRDQTHVSCISWHWQEDSLPPAPPGKP